MKILYGILDIGYDIFDRVSRTFCVVEGFPELAGDFLLTAVPYE